jgi:hypothetical protein
LSAAAVQVRAYAKYAPQLSTSSLGRLLLRKVRVSPLLLEERGVAVVSTAEPSSEYKHGDHVNHDDPARDAATSHGDGHNRADVDGEESGGDSSRDGDGGDGGGGGGGALSRLRSAVSRRAADVASRVRRAFESPDERLEWLQVDPNTITPLAMVPRGLRDEVMDDMGIRRRFSRARLMSTPMALVGRLLTNCSRSNTVASSTLSESKGDGGSSSSSEDMYADMSDDTTSDEVIEDEDLQARLDR